MPVTFWTNDNGSAQILNGSEFDAIRASFQTWQNIPTADVRFEYKGTTPIRTVGHDGVNVITFADDTIPLGTSTIAATFSFFRNEGGVVVNEESDIAFSPA